MSTSNAFYAQSGGVTAVINATAAGVIQTAQQYPNKIHKVYAGKDGILGALHENLIDTSLESHKAIEALKYTPAGAFGSCRYKLKSLQDNAAEYHRLIEVFKAHNIHYFFYNGGGDSQDTAHKIAQMSQELNYPLISIGIPKTVDNDLPLTDNCPGFGSVAKYVAISTLEASLDVASMASSSTKVFVMEVMGRHAGWIAAASALAQSGSNTAPHIILFPEIPFNQDNFLNAVQKTVNERGFCVIVASEGVKHSNGQFLADAGSRDAFGHTQLGGVAPYLAQMIKSKLKLKNHWAVCDYLQRAARHIASKTDLDQAIALGRSAVELAMAGENACMPIIVRTSNQPYQWRLSKVPLDQVANIEKVLPQAYISDSGFGITPECRAYLQPLIEGEAFPPFHQGLPQYIRLNNTLINKKCPNFTKLEV